MQTVLIAILLLALAMLALSVGLMFGRSPLKRSCSGEACLTACAGCDRHARRPTP
jgi:hypothetical protein